MFTLMQVVDSVLEPFAGKDVTLTTREIQAAVLEVKPDANLGSLNIPDHVASDRQATQYATHNLVRVPGGYKVLPRSEWVAKPTTGRGQRNGQSISAAAESVKAKLAALTPEAS